MRPAAAGDAAPAAGGDRLAAIDVARATAVVLMVVVHFAENLSGWQGGAGGAFEGIHRTWWLPTGFAAPTFTLLAGISYRLWRDAQRRRGRTDEVIARVTARRGLFLIGLGFAFNVLVWLPEDVFNWDILTLIGCGLLVLGGGRRMPDTLILALAGLVVAVAPTMRVLADYAAHWTEGYYDYEFTFSDVALGWLVTGYFPLFPWLAYPLVGYALAPCLLRPAERHAAASVPCGGWIPAVLIAVAAALIPAWPTLPEAVTDGTIRSWTMFPASTAYVAGTLGGVLAALAGLHRLLDGPVPRCDWLVGWARPLSRHALSIYLLHHVVHVWPLWAVGLATTGDPTALWQMALPIGASLGLAVAFLVAAAILFRGLDRHRVPAVESAMRWICD